MRLVGLTGGIASGKTSVASVLKEHGVAVLSCDAAAKQVVEQGCPGYKKVIAKFGEAILLPSGEIDRVKLGDLVFNDAENRDALNKCIHPEIAKVIRRHIIWHFIKGTTIVAVDIPLLYESCNINPFLHSIVVVYCTAEQQKVRLMDRNDHFTEEEAQARVDSQLCIEEKRKRGDHVIDNTGLFSETERQVAALVPHLKDGIVPIQKIILLGLFALIVFIVWSKMF
ncbi:dephospho-CoA kinase-like [Bolinopsis microptera]|uniref:dephospho-CoA kinase-like n=1 Tax=Bolinopsis microptera TaxID=2820187 RepID=UPI00307A7028